MKHDFIDKYCHLDSPLHRLDPRTKLLLTLTLLMIITATNKLLLFAGYYLLLVILVAVSRVPLAYYLKRALLITPFVIMIAIFMLLSGQSAGPSSPSPTYIRVAIIVFKTYASIILLTLLTSVTRFNCLLWAMRKFRFPPVITTLSRLVYTYTFLLVDELHSAQRAIKSRAPVIRMPKTKLYGNLAASILLKSIQRSRIVYYAMVSRKFNGEFPEGSANHFRRIDLLAGCIFILLNSAFYILWKWNL